jgi:hypothetical protein
MNMHSLVTSTQDADLTRDLDLQPRSELAIKILTCALCGLWQVVASDFSWQYSDVS